MKLLLTGFEPFGGSPVNPSQQIVFALAQRSFAGLVLYTAILPVDRVDGPAAALNAIHEHQPDAVLCLGQAARRPALSIERVAVNLLDYAIPDNAGNRVVDEPVVAGGPAAYFATLPLRRMLAAVQAAHVPCELSLSAGAFLCNQVLYAVLHHLAHNSSTTRAGFIHVPSLPEQVVSKPAPSMSLETMIAGVQAAISAIGETK
jgi:pyroglutamyl-peptidase